MSWLTKLMGDPNHKVVRRLQPAIDQINALEPEYTHLSPAVLREKTPQFRARFLAGETLDDLLPEAFAAVREAAKRTLGQRPHDVQILGGIVLHQGMIAEMKTGEGKTLTATLPAYLNALTGEGVHVVTVNDYLARFHAEWMGQIYRFLGLSVAAILSSDRQLPPEERRATRQAAYAADITYGVNSEFGFDYLGDNLATSQEECVQRTLTYALVDEVDNIFIDVARTPLILSGQAEESAEMYDHFARLVPQLRQDEDYTVEDRTKTVSLTEDGLSKMERLLGVENIYDARNIQLTHYLEQAVKAQALFKRDKDYVVRDGAVIIVDEFTGRLMQGRRYSEGLHQAIEAKEGVTIERETVTQATITIQNYFRMYEKLAGMTGTAATEAEEFHKIYKLEVVTIPTARPMIREDLPDLVYKGEAGKFRAVVEEIKEHYERGQPVLVGTISIEKSEHLHEMLTREGVPHNVLNAKQHEREAAIVREAGCYQAVTISTNMAGRGTDIILGGSLRHFQEEVARTYATNDEQKALLAQDAMAFLATLDADLRAQVEAEAQVIWQKEHDRVLELGGLHIVGTERHEARRIDNQLRGRAGRQGDPGSSRFFVSLDDDLLKRVGSDRAKGMLERLGLPDDEAIESTMVSRFIESAQTKVEGWNFDVRKHLVDYDDVLNNQRTVIYADRRRVLEGADVHDIVAGMVEDEVRGLCEAHLLGNHQEEWQSEELLTAITSIFPLPDAYTPEYLAAMTRDEVINVLQQEAQRAYTAREEAMTPENMRMAERFVLLRVIDSLWIQHYDAMDALREGSWLAGVGQKDPLVEFKATAYDMFQELQAAIQHDIVHLIYHMEVQRMEELPAAFPGTAPNVIEGVAKDVPRPGAQSAKVQRATGAPPRRQARPAARGVPTSPMAGQQANPFAARSGGSALWGAGGQEVVPRKIGRNEPCSCGSGKKYKMCHGR